MAVGALGCDKPVPQDRFGAVADFTLTESGAKKVKRDDLQNKVWIASFIFTRCAGPCSQITGSMARLQHDLAAEKDLLLVTFTVDPDHDTPEVLRAYAERFGARPERWLFLTGAREPLYQLIRESFHLGVEQQQGTARRSGDEVLHSTKLVVVDRQGQIRGYFDGKDENELAGLKTKIAELLKERP
jgi:cytochrome oxidase Cu insertion factor (SCO1/SenC/PrrC family)